MKVGDLVKILEPIYPTLPAGTIIEISIMDTSRLNIGISYNDERFWFTEQEVTPATVLQVVSEIFILCNSKNWKVTMTINASFEWSFTIYKSSSSHIISHKDINTIYRYIKVILDTFN